MVPDWLLIAGAVVTVIGGILLVLIRFTDLFDRWITKPEPIHDPKTDPAPLITDPARLAQEMHKIKEEQAKARSRSLIEYGLLLVLIAMIALVAVSLAGPESVPTTTLP